MREQLRHTEETPSPLPKKLKGQGISIAQLKAKELVPPYSGPSSRGTCGDTSTPPPPQEKIQTLEGTLWQMATAIERLCERVQHLEEGYAKEEDTETPPVAATTPPLEAMAAACSSGQENPSPCDTPAPPCRTHVLGNASGGGETSTPACNTHKWGYAWREGKARTHGECDRALSGGIGANP